MSQADLHLVPDGETLRKLASGLEIVRRKKHEWRDSLDNLIPRKLEIQTNKIFGSKFSRDWKLPTLVDWIESVVVQEGWNLNPGTAMAAERQLERTIGLADGKPTHRIKVVCDGRYVHAYPIKE
jgi:hypothetical protein